MTTQTPATAEIEKWLRWFVFSQIFDSGSDKKKRRILAESTPDPWPPLICCQSPLLWQHRIQVKPFNAERTKNMRSLNPEDIDQLITVCGMVIRSSSLIPEMREGFFRCSVCKYETTVEIERGRIAEPSSCVHCKTNYSMALVHNRSLFTDRWCTCFPVFVFRSQTEIFLKWPKKYSHFGQHVWKSRLLNTAMTSFNTTVRQLTKMSQQIVTEKSSLFFTRCSFLWQSIGLCSSLHFPNINLCATIF